MDNHQYVNQDSGCVEWYTPSYLLDAVRSVLNGIELDPASSATANECVRAARFYTMADDGLSLPWICTTLWMNHPYSREGNRLWIEKLANEYAIGNTKEALCISFASTSESWFQPLMQYPLAFLSKRVRFISADGTPGKSPTKGSAVAYLGPNVDRFASVFRELGNVMLPSKGADYD